MLWRRIALLASILVPAAALAQGFGSAAFQDADTILVIDRPARTEGLKFERIVLPNPHRVVLQGGLYFDGPEPLKADALPVPVVRPLAPDRTLVLGRFGGLYDVTETGSAEIWEAGYQVTEYLASTGPNGTPYLLAHATETAADGSPLEFLRLLRGQVVPTYGPWEEVAGSVFLFTPCDPIGLDIDTADEPVIFCSDRTFDPPAIFRMTVDGQSFDYTLTTSLTASMSTLVPHVSPTTFFLATYTTDGTFGTVIQRATLSSSGAFAIEPVATLPIADITKYDGLLPGGRDFLAVSGYRLGQTHRPHELWAVTRDGSGWTTDQLADDLDQYDHIDARPEGPEVIAGSERLRLFRRDPSGNWTTTDLGNIGDDRCLACNPLRCDVGFGDPARIGLGAVLAGCLALAAFRTSRARSRAKPERPAP